MNEKTLITFSLLIEVKIEVNIRLLKLRQNARMYVNRSPISLTLNAFRAAEHNHMHTLTSAIVLCLLCTSYDFDNT